ncbi:hypothetical protein MKX03_021661 [Papaver bracteatum]|nr:hypothetical protein MKX03_021661 [Papaver bracteatum]
MSIKVQLLSSKLVGPIYNGDEQPPPNTNQFAPLSVFDWYIPDEHVPVIYAFKTPNPSNAFLEQGLGKVLSEYRVWAGRLGKDENNHSIILLNDKGVRFIEASADRALEQVMPFNQSTLLTLHPDFEGMKEILIIQLTRFTCGSLVISFSSNHMVADGFSVSQFLVSWGRVCRGLDINPRPLHNREIFVPRNPCRLEFDHQSLEFTKGVINDVFIDPLNVPPYSEEDVIYHKLHFPIELIAKLKSKAGSSASGKPYTTFESLVAHLWRTITKVRGLTCQTTEIKIAVNGRKRLIPQIPDEYFGNLVLCAYPAAQVKELVNGSLRNIASIIHESVVRLKDDYFKSYIDFVSNDMQGENPTPERGERTLVALWPNLEFDSWLGFPFNEVDFGFGKPCLFMPSFDSLEGLVYLVPAIDGGVDVYVCLFKQQMALFDEICYSID